MFDAVAASGDLVPDTLCVTLVESLNEVSAICGFERYVRRSKTSSWSAMSMIHSNPWLERLTLQLALPDQVLPSRTGVTPKEWVEVKSASFSLRL